MKRFMMYAALLVCAIFLAACGGGGESMTVVSDGQNGGGVTPPPGTTPPPAVKDSFTIDFVAPDIAEVTFGDNSISFGLVSAVDPADVEFIQWRSDKAGWGDNGIATGVLWKDASGKIFATVANMPLTTDQGNFVVKLKGSNIPVWFNGGLWNALLDGKVSPNAAFIGDPVGQFKYAR